MYSKEERIDFFKNELDSIKSEKRRSFAEYLIENADDYFFTVAASTSGKYHPKFDLGNGGLVRHTRCVVFFAICEAESRCFSDDEKDLLIVSAIAHDIKKLGDGSGNHTVNDHPKFAAEYVMKCYEDTKLVTKKDANTIHDMVFSHMGKWGAEYGMPVPKTDLEKALQSADYIASRKEILDFDFKPTDISFKDIKQNKVASVSLNVNSPGSYRIDFGKKAGKTIAEIYEDEKDNINRGYLMWMVGMKDFNKTDARNSAILFLSEKKCLPDEYKSELNELVNNSNSQVKEDIVFNESDPTEDLPF